jgi:hypothetical protein
MHHLDEQAIELFLSGELSDSEAEALRDHLARCSACDDRVAATRKRDEEIGASLSLLGHPVPRLDAEAVIRRSGGRWRRSHTVAAGIALLVVGGAASAMPGSPVRAWLGDIVSGPREASEPALGPVLPSGVSVIPSGAFELVFEAGQETGVIRVSLTDDPELSVRATGGSPGFTLEPERVRVANSGSSANYDIQLPRTAASFRLRVGDSVLMSLRDGTVTSPATAVRGEYVFEFAALR